MHINKQPAQLYTCTVEAPQAGTQTHKHTNKHKINVKQHNYTHIQIKNTCKTGEPHTCTLHAPQANSQTRIHPYAKKPTYTQNTTTTHLAFASPSSLNSNTYTYVRIHTNTQYTQNNTSTHMYFARPSS